MNGHKFQSRTPTKHLVETREYRSPNKSINLHCKNCSVINTPNFLYAHTNMVEGVSMEQMWCVYHTIYHTVVFTVYPMTEDNRVVG